MSTDFKTWMQRIQTRTESALVKHLPTCAPTRLHEAMRYAALGGGKRVRPLLVFAAGALFDAPAARLDNIACALECIHVYSLVHDDMPCMDDDVLRRGKPTVHVAFDDATALLVGDALQSEAFTLLAQPGLFDDAATQVAALSLLAQASGSRGMAGGQAIDLAAVGQKISLAELENMHHHKTGALIRAAVQLGAMAGTQSVDTATAERLQNFGRCIGLLFQVVDDILDTVADTATLGKTAGKDAAADKPTYVSLLGLDEARRHASALHQNARDLLAPFGERATQLLAITDYIIHRSA